MSGTLALTGDLIAAPQVSTDNPFPAGTTEVPISLSPSPKAYNLDSGRLTGVISSPNAFVALQGLGGAGGQLTKAHTLYFRCGSPVVVRETTVNPAGGTLQASCPVSGLHLREYPAGSELTALEVEGAASCEWYFAGNS